MCAVVALERNPDCCGEEQCMEREGTACGKELAMPYMDEMKGAGL